MNNKELVKLDLLKRKIFEFFSKNPRSKSAIFKMELGGDKTHWRVTKNKNKQYSIVEVKSQRKEFLLTEAPIGQVKTQEAEQQAQDQQQADLSQVPPPATTQPAVASVPMAPINTAPMGPVQTPAVTPAPVSPIPSVTPTIVGTGAAKLAAQAVRDAAATDPEGFKQEFGATPEAILKNPMVPPDLPTGTAPPEVRGGQNITAGKEPLKEASQAFSHVSRLFMTALNQGEHSGYSTARQMIQSLLPSITDPQERQSVGGMIGQLTSLEDESTASSANAIPSMQGAVTQPVSRAWPSLPRDVNSKNRKGNIIKEQDDLKKKDIGVNDPAGLEADPVKNYAFNPSTSEESALVQALKGQVVQDVKLTNDEDSISIELKLVATDWPAVFEMHKDGKLIFIIKNRRYVLNKKWN